MKLTRGRIKEVSKLVNDRTIGKTEGSWIQAVFFLYAENFFKFIFINFMYQYIISNSPLFSCVMTLGSTKRRDWRCISEVLSGTIHPYLPILMSTMYTVRPLPNLVKVIVHCKSNAPGSHSTLTSATKRSGSWPWAWEWQRVSRPRKGGCYPRRAGSFSHQVQKALASLLFRGNGKQTTISSIFVTFNSG